MKIGRKSYFMKSGYYLSNISDMYIEFILKRKKYVSHMLLKNKFKPSSEKIMVYTV